MQTIKEVHIKVSHNEETRRFLLEEVSYDKLVELLKTLFSINPVSTLDLKYQDDEQDWVILGSSEDLIYAASLSKTVKLIFTVQKLEADKTDKLPESASLLTVSTPSEKEELPSPQPSPSFGGKWRGNGRCGGRGRGRRGRGMGRGNCGTVNVGSRISFKISKLEEKIASGSYPENKIEQFNARLEKLRVKQAALAESNENLVDPSRAEKLGSRIAILEEKLTHDMPEGRRNAIINNIERLKAKQEVLTSEVPPSERFKWKGNPERIQQRIQLIKEKLESGSVEGQRKQILENRLVKLEEKLKN